MTEQTITELLYRYAIPSQVRRADNSSVLLLGTSDGGTTEVTEGPALHPYFFKGFLTQPAPAAAGMLACAAIARARYYHAPGSAIAKVIADPVVTSNDDRLRFESFSGCCGVHARPDLMPDALDEARRATGTGTTNVDFNEPIRAARSPSAGSRCRPAGATASVRPAFAPNVPCVLLPACPWWGQHRGTRGPCKHVLATRMAVRPDEH